MLSDFDKFNPTGSGGDFGVFDQWPQVNTATFTMEFCRLKYRGKSKREGNCDVKFSGDDKENASFASLFTAVCCCSQLKMKVSILVVVIVCPDIQDSGK